MKESGETPCMAHILKRPTIGRFLFPFNYYSCCFSVLRPYRNVKGEIGILRKKKYIWAFPGIGKSELHPTTSGSLPSILDAESRLFQYHFPENHFYQLHRREPRHGLARNPEYPQNYLDFVRSVEADIVLLNCHPSFLKDFDQEELLLVYPSETLKDEYLQRYSQRGDTQSFLNYMDEAFEDMVATLRRAPFLKFEIGRKHVYLQELLDGGILMSQFITKKELTALLDESIRLGSYVPSDDLLHKTPVELSQMMFDGEVELDLDTLRKELNNKKEEVEKERLILARRGGLSHEELRDKIMQGIVNGALYITHGEISPYSYGFEIKYPADHFKYTNRWECYCSFPEVAERITSMIEKGQQDKEVFSSNQLQPLDIQAMLRLIDEKEQTKLTSFTEQSKTQLEPRGRYTGHVARLSDVHNGIALDGIIQGHFHGDYSSITTSSQNEMLDVLVAMKGFCLDCLPRLDSTLREYAIQYLKVHGTDVSTPEKLQAWINANPQKCGLQANRQRKPSLESRMDHADKRRDAQLPASDPLSLEPDR